MFEKNLARLEALEPLITAVNRDDISSLASFLYDRITHPDSYVVFLGETSSGKSSIINGFLGEDLLPVRACPSTASIAEVELLDRATADEYLAIYNNASAEVIDKELFRHYCESPCENLNRIRVSKHLPGKKISGLRLFDTPGYDSIVTQHEEVLKEFIPNSDVVVYVINYRTGIQRLKVGIQEEDFVFLSALKELVREDAEIILLINRCPLDMAADDRRIAEIREYAENLLGFSPQYFTIFDTSVSAGMKHAQPINLDFWECIRMTVESESRRRKLENAFDDYILELYIKCDTIINTRYANALLSDEEHNALIDIQREYARRIRKANEDLVIPTFNQLSNSIPKLFNEVNFSAKKLIEKSITDSPVANKDEMVAYTNIHLLPYIIGRETKNTVMDHIETVITDLNKKVDDYIQKEVIEFSNEITIRLNSNLDVASRSVAAKVIQDLSKNALGKYFIQYGGLGGTNAGIANAASHLLKKVGDTFGKRFPLETHNALKHFLKKCGATSMKAVAAAVTVVTEVVFMAIDAATWRPLLKKKVRKGIDEWEKEALDGVQVDLMKLRDVNVETVLDIARDIEDSFEEDISKNADKYLAQVHLSSELGKLFK